MMASRVGLGVAIVGLAVFFIYRNMDYLSFVGDEAVNRLTAEGREEVKPKKSKPKAKKPGRTKESRALAGEHLSADDVLGAPVFQTPDTPIPSTLQQLLLTPPQLTPPPQPLPSIPSLSSIPPEEPSTPLLPPPSPQQSIPEPPIPESSVPEPSIQPPPAPPPAPPVKTFETMLLTHIACRLADRDDIRFTMSLELSFDDDALRDEIYFKRGMLSTIASGVVRRFEFGNVTLPALGAELLAALNGQLKGGQLKAVEVREFRAENVGGG
jgi:hypothetical protein